MLKQNSEFQQVYRRGRSAHSTSLTLFYLPMLGEKKVGYTASKKVGNAVIRNRSKRRLRALFTERKNGLDDGLYVFVAKKGVCENSFESVKRDFNYVLKRMGITKSSD